MVKVKSLRSDAPLIRTAHLARLKTQVFTLSQPEHEREARAFASTLTLVPFAPKTRLPMQTREPISTNPPAQTRVSHLSSSCAGHRLALITLIPQPSH
jgi:hypothetical protein